MVKNKKSTCVICDNIVEEETGFMFNFNDDVYWFCESHAKPFKMGMSLGQVEINSKFLSFISSLPDSEIKDDFKKQLKQLTPMSKLVPQKTQSDTAVQVKDELNTPKQLCDKISQVVIGQEDAKRSISVSVINHLQFINDTNKNTSHSDKHHVLMLGKSGSGKTLIANTVAKLYDLPFAMGDATNYSPTGFQGSDAESVVHDLFLESNLDIESTEKGIIFVDEIDKICTNNKNANRIESLATSTQSTFLKLIEGKNVKVPGPVYGDMHGTFTNINTNNMLFFFGGAFNGLADIVANKMGKKSRTIGFIKTDEDKTKDIDEALKSYEIFSQANREDIVESLIEFGMLSEFIGRVPTIVALKPLSKEDLTKVLFESKVSPLEKQKTIFSKSGYTIEFTSEFVDKLVDISYRSAVGTRALDSYVKKAVSMASFDLLSLNSGNHKGRVIIKEDCILNPSLYELSASNVHGVFEV